MQLLDRKMVYSASDLVAFVACKNLANLRYDREVGLIPAPPAASESVTIVAELGEEHERRYLLALRESGVNVVSIERAVHTDPDPAVGDRAAAAVAAISEQVERTLAAMRQGASVIYQATFFDGSSVGYADILRRVETPSNFGPWSYEVEDTKLARKAKPYFLLQLCFYSEHLHRVQGTKPERMYVVLGNGKRRAFRLNDFVDYYRALKARFLNWLGEAEAGIAAAAYPYPVSHCGVCRWNPICTKRRKDDDHLSEVFGLTRLQASRLEAIGIRSVASLATAGDDVRHEKIDRSTFDRLTDQARLQIEARNLPRGSEPPFKALPFSEPGEPPRGFALLPESSSGDVFFDMEGDPYYDVDRGLEYLFGAVTIDRAFHAFWGCDRGAGPFADRLAEKRAFEAFIDFIMERRERFPEMHVYHYASYEKTKLGELAKQHGTREDEVNVLLREQRLVDLFQVVRQGLRIGLGSYGLKSLEVFLGPRGRRGVSKADDSIVEFERWLATRNGQHGGDGRILEDIEQYNRKDCESTLDLRDWLVVRRDEAERKFGVSAKPPAVLDTEPASTRVDKHAELKISLADRIPETFDPADGSKEHPYPLWLALQLLNYYDREARPTWWAFYALCEDYRADPRGFAEGQGVILDLELIDGPLPVKRSVESTFRFPFQEMKVETGVAYDPLTGLKVGEVVRIAEGDPFGTLVIKRGPSIRPESPERPQAIIIRNDYNTAPLVDALARFSNALLDGTSPARVYRAAFDLLTGGPPRFRSRAAGATIQPNKVDAGAIQSLIDDLDSSYLFIQGPPGSGKTHQGAQAIVELLREGKSVGVTANSHTAINNLLAKVEEIAEGLGLSFEGQRKASDPDDYFESQLGDRAWIRNLSELAPGPGRVVAGTFWAFAPMDSCLDYLFIDEAGQVALPNAVAASISARSVVLLGDPLQLSHVRHGAHPGDVGTSVLEYLLKSDAVAEESEEDALRPVSETRGVLLTESWRMHPDVCKVVSDLMYASRLHAHDRCRTQAIHAPGLPSSGVLYISVEHSDGKSRSQAEANEVADLVDRLLGATVTGSDGCVRTITSGDIIVVTPYNNQRRCIERTLANRGPASSAVQVGTVDKFQGREAEVVIFSSATATPDDAPRGLEFIFDRNRLNVAISRAKALAIYVGSPKLIDADPTSIKRMLALNAGCAIVAAGTEPAMSMARRS